MNLPLDPRRGIVPASVAGDADRTIRLRDIEHPDVVVFRPSSSVPRSET